MRVTGGGESTFSREDEIPGYAGPADVCIARLKTLLHRVRKKNGTAL